MSTTTRTALRLLVATPLAAAALTVGGVAGIVGAAHADATPAGPGTIALPLPGGDPQPNPQGPGDITNPEPGDDPRPDGPGEITNPEPGDDPGPQGPDDKAGPNPGDGPRPEGPGEIAIPDPQDKPDTPVDQGGKNVPGGKETKDTRDEPAAQPQVEAPADVPVPTRIDAGAGAVQDEAGQLAWLLAGGGAMTAAGSVLAGRRLARGRR
ncbi:hypothetical protein KVF89_15340 [Nocardioides carbamazepini]|uniref:hypothetical protein n=1 Tax=Nocardioides carbamazepini TaxID=2854259 RepID=UPI002149EEF4|nr:hypothetical protein [Nocardioides carbamazepini]MCR1783914.1 hypothetical protein [Nocardioides carbamazepini]